VLGAILICDLMQIVPIAIIRFADVPTRFWFENALQFSALLTGIASRSKRINITVLAALIALYAYTAVMSFIQPPPL
jgi:hypothetical protein